MGIYILRNRREIMLIPSILSHVRPSLPPLLRRRFPRLYRRTRAAAMASSSMERRHLRVHDLDCAGLPQLLHELRCVV